MAWMYILRCCDDSYYVGSSKDLDERMHQHQQGTGARYTRLRLPVQLIYAEEYEQVWEAHTREKQVQNWSRAKREALINGTTEDLPRLAKKHFRRRVCTAGEQ